MFAVVLAAILGTFVYTLYAPAYRITSIEVNGASKIDRESVTRFIDQRLNDGVLGFRWKRVYYLTPVASLARELRTSIERLVSVNDLSISRRGRNVLVVDLSERTPNMIWETQRGNRYTVDEKGIVVERLTVDAPQSFKVLKDSNNLPVDIGSNVARPEYLSAIDSIANSLANLQISPSSYATWKVKCRTVRAVNVNDEQNVNTDAVANTNSINTNVNAPDTVTGNEPVEQSPCDPYVLAINDPTVVAVTVDGVELRFDTSTNIEAQVEKLRIALSERLSDRLTSLDYIDVRFGNKVYYQ